MAGHRDLVPDRFLDLVLYLVIHKRRRSRTQISSDHAYFFEFRRLYVFFEGLVISIRCRLKTFTYTNITTRTLFFL